MHITDQEECDKLFENIQFCQQTDNTSELKNLKKKRKHPASLLNTKNKRKLIYKRSKIKKNFKR